MLIGQVFHADHGVPMPLIQWAVDSLNPSGFFLSTLEIPTEYGDLQSAIHGPVAGDEPVNDQECFMVRRTPDRPMSRMCGRKPRAVRQMTIIGNVSDDGVVTVYTCYGGPAAEREPGGEGMTDEENAEASSFWAKHALSAELGRKAWQTWGGFAGLFHSKKNSL